MRVAIVGAGLADNSCGVSRCWLGSRNLESRPFVGVMAVGLMMITMLRWASFWLLLSAV